MGIHRRRARRIRVNPDKRPTTTTLDGELFPKCLLHFNYFGQRHRVESVEGRNFLFTMFCRLAHLIGVGGFPTGIGPSSYSFRTHTPALLIGRPKAMYLRHYFHAMVIIRFIARNFALLDVMPHTPQHHNSMKQELYQNLQRTHGDGTLLCFAGPCLFDSEA